MIVRRLRITGRVQGVGFRYALQHEATRLGATGWVRNRGDGSVEALVQGSAESVDALIAWAKRGPPGARVTDLQAEAGAQEALAGFELRATL
jgi:acylphosphatase